MSTEIKTSSSELEPELPNTKQMNACPSKRGDILMTHDDYRKMIETYH